MVFFKKCVALLNQSFSSEEMNKCKPKAQIMIFDYFNIFLLEFQNEEDGGNSVLDGSRSDFAQAVWVQS
jgi:hypothetical protein